MNYDGIGVNMEWLRTKTEDEFINEYMDALNDAFHPVASMKPEEKRKYYSRMYRHLLEIPEKVETEKPDTKLTKKG